MASDAERRKQKYPKGGGPHRQQEQSQADFEAAKKAAIAKSASGQPEEVTCISKFVVAICWREEWRACYNCRLDEAAYQKKFSECLDVDMRKMTVKRNIFLLSFAYGFPIADPFSKNLTLDRWRLAFAALRLNEPIGPVDAGSCPPGWRDFEQNAVVRMEGNKVHVDLQCYAAWADDMKAMAAFTLEVADGLANGPRCPIAGVQCCRYSWSGQLGALCCHLCRDSSGAEHTEDCNKRWHEAQSQSRQEELAAARRIYIASPPTAAIQMITMVETPRSIMKLADLDLQAIAESVGSSGARLVGDVEEVSSTGRFTCQCLGGERVGCFLCHTSPMIRWCWHDHASRKGHKEKVRRFQEASHPDMQNATVSSKGDGGSLVLGNDANVFALEAPMPSNAAFAAGMEAASRSARRPSKQHLQPAREGANAHSVQHIIPAGAESHGDVDESLAFLENLEALRAWFKKHRDGTYPLKHEGARGKLQAEHSLAWWVYNQRTYYKADKLTVAQVQQLESIAEWSWDPHTSAWEESYKKVKTWLETHKKYPSKHSKEPSEQQLGDWVSKQMRAYSGSRKPLLTEGRVHELQELPKWQFPATQASWSAMFTQLKLWRQRHGCMPEDAAHVATKQRWLPLGRWYLCQLNDPGGTARQKKAFADWRQSVT